MKKTILLLIFIVSGLIAKGQSDPTPSSPFPGSLIGFQQINGTDTIPVFNQLGKWYNIAGRSWLANHYYSKTNRDSVAQQSPNLLKFNYLGGSPRTTAIFSANPSGWDQGFGESGNVIKVGDTLITVYSGFHTPYVSNAVYMGIAVSTDNGATWVKKGLNGDGQALFAGHESEDPYIVSYQGLYYAFVEDKNAVPFRNIKMYTTDSYNHAWVDRGVILNVGSGTTWDSMDVSSPTVKIIGNTFNLYFEGRQSGGGGQQGMVGLATATISLTPTFTKYVGNPIIQGSNGTGTIQIPWGRNIVPDDIVSNNGKLYMTCHIFNLTNFVEGMLVSNDGITWVDYLGSWVMKSDGNEINGAGLSMYFDGKQYVGHYINSTSDGVLEGYLLTQTFQNNGTKVITGGGLNISNLYNGATSTSPAPITASIAASMPSSLPLASGLSVSVANTVSGIGGSLNGLKINVDKGGNTGASIDTGISVAMNTGARAAGGTSITYPGITVALTGSSATTSTASGLKYVAGDFKSTSVTAVGETSTETALKATATGISGMTTEGIQLNATGGTTNYAANIITGGVHLTPLTASLPLFTDANKVITTNAITGTGSVVMSASPTLTGSPLAPTQTALDNSTKIATTAYSDALKTAIATLTNKTLTSPQINTPKLNTTSVIGNVWTASGTDGSGGWAAPAVSATSVTRLSPLDSISGAAKGATISGHNLVLQSADASTPGLMNSGTQIFGGSKTWGGQTLFNADVQISNTSNLRVNIGSKILMYDNTNTYTTSLYAPGATANRVITEPDASGIHALTGETDNVSSKTADYTIVSGDFATGKKTTLDLYVDATLGNVTITLPSASTFKGYTIYVTKTDLSVNTVTVNTVSGNNTLITQYQERQFNSDGTNWYNH